MNFFNVIGLGEAKLWDFYGSVIWRYLIFLTPVEIFDEKIKWIFVERRPRAFQLCVTCVTVTIRPNSTSTVRHIGRASRSRSFWPHPGGFVTNSSPIVRLF